MFFNKDKAREEFIKSPSNKVRLTESFEITPEKLKQIVTLYPEHTYAEISQVVGIPAYRLSSIIGTMRAYGIKIKSRPIKKQSLIESIEILKKELEKNV